jgi:hypothetical protein
MAMGSRAGRTETTERRPYSTKILYSLASAKKSPRWFRVAKHHRFFSSCSLFCDSDRHLPLTAIFLAETSEYTWCGDDSQLWTENHDPVTALIVTTPPFPQRQRIPTRRQSMIAHFLSDMDFTVNCGSPVYRTGNMIMKRADSQNQKKNWEKNLYCRGSPRGNYLWNC